jgi:hypothetical protein
MKRINFAVTDGPFKSQSILGQVMSVSPESKINVGEMRKRVRVLDALEAAEKIAQNYIDLEDADFDMLKGAIEGFPFQIANKDILKTVDAINEAKAPPTPAETDQLAPTT